MWLLKGMQVAAHRGNLHLTLQSFEPIMIQQSYTGAAC
jgi:hypothetical protein